ncbi:CHAT domain-containing protein [Micromonospora chalcea]|uniref:CHAT domain-containing protein n=1 Tax=Micromonospora chalcea TaxID=1874 RepID=UPI0038F66A59
MDQANRKIAQLRKDEADLRKKLSDAQSAASKARKEAETKRQQAARTSSASMTNSYLRSAQAADKKAVDQERKVADLSKKLSDVATKQSAAMRELESATKAAERQRVAADARRRSEEKRHAQEVARLSRPTVRYVHEVRVVEPPKPEKLRVLYLAANPDPASFLRVDVEVREVRQAVRKAAHRDLVEIDHRSAATPEDLLDGINEFRPHVVHFSGHGGGAALLFDDGRVEDSSGRVVSFDLLARALGATDQPPKLLVLNACDTLDGADVLLPAVPVLIAMSASISDLAATAFAARFYSAIANAQSVRSALDQGAVAVDLLDLREGWKPNLLARAEIDVQSMQLVEPMPA